MKVTAVLAGLAAGLLISFACHAQEGPARPPELKVLERFVGAWDSKAVGKPAAWTPQGITSTGWNKYEWVLDTHFLQATEMNTDGSAALGWWTYDPRATTYRGWFFLADGSMVEWQGRWHEDGQGLRMEANMRNGVTLNGTNHFPNKDTYEWTYIAKDKAGKSYLDVKETHRRRRSPPDNPKEKKGAAGPPELKVLDRYLGTWKTETVKKVAAWNPREMRTTGTVTNEWVLNGRFIQQRGKELNGAEHIQIRGYDPETKQFRHWHFHSQGSAIAATGSWDQDAMTMTWKTDLGNGIAGTNTVRFVGSDTIDWRLVARNEEGKVFVDMEGKFQRRP
jgi:hypothetical protein